MNFIPQQARLILNLLPIVTISLAGCASSTPSTLLALPDTAAIASPLTSVRKVMASMPVAAVARLEIPEYLSSRRVRYKVDASTVGEWPGTYWAERIEVSFTREFTKSLQTRLPTWRLCEGSCTELSPVVSLVVVVSQMDYVRGEKKLYGAAKISINRQSSSQNALLGEERRYEIIATGDSAQAQAQAISELLRQIAADAAALIVPAA